MADQEKPPIAESKRGIARPKQQGTLPAIANLNHPDIERTLRVVVENQRLINAYAASEGITCQEVVARSRTRSSCSSTRLRRATRLRFMIGSH
jgi:hypothetical protein